MTTSTGTRGGRGAAAALRPYLPTGAARLSRRVARLGGSLTSSARMRPAFLIVGAQRAGTTSLYRVLTEHPAVAPAVLRKGIRYFDIHYSRGWAWYQGHFPLRARAALTSRRLGTRVITGEASPYYLAHPAAPARIAAALPDVRVLVLVRDPVERAYSQYSHERARGFETETFERALELEPQRLAGEVERLRADPTYHSVAHQHWGYLARSTYIDQLEEFARWLPREQILVQDSEDFFGHPEPVYDAVLSFLGLPPYRPTTFEQHNARRRAPLAPDTAARLAAHFAPLDDRLAVWLGREPAWRR